MRILSSHHAHVSFVCIFDKLSISSKKNVTPTIDFPHFWNVLFGVFSIFVILDLNVDVCNDFPQNSVNNIKDL